MEKVQGLVTELVRAMGMTRRLAEVLQHSTLKLVALGLFQRRFMLGLPQVWGLGLQEPLQANKGRHQHPADQSNLPDEHPNRAA